MAKEYLSQKGIAFTEYDVAADRGKVRELVEISGQMGVPVIVVNGEIIIGFDRSRLEGLIR